MKSLTLTITVLAMLLSCTPLAQAENYRDIYPDTWVATDALGREMPEFVQVGPIKKDQRRDVGIFYITWHDDGKANRRSPYSADVTKILAADPNARLDGTNPLWDKGMHHWGEPEEGYFLSKDEYIIYKDMSMLADAGVDVLILDVTNGVHYWSEWDTMFKVMAKMKAQGNKVPKFCFWAFNGIVITVVQDLYDNYYKNEKYKDLWYYWDDKPLLLYNSNPSMDANRGGIKHPNRHYDPKAKTDKDHPHYGDPDYCEEFYQDYTKEVKEFFTTRTMWWGYYEWAGKRYLGQEDNWSFGYDMHDERVSSMKLHELISTHKGKREAAAVTPAQHPTSMVGKSWSRKTGEPKMNEYDLPVPTYVPWLGKTVENPEGYGIYFQERWDEALKCKPQFIYINDWNEWTAGKYHAGELNTTVGKPIHWLKRDSTYFFVDQYNSEFNRGVQPMKDGYSDNYYMQMAQNIRKYKGARQNPQLKGFQAINIDGNFRDWQNSTDEFRDTIGDTISRDYPGYGGLHYKNNNGRNDITTSKVALDKKNIYFYAQTNEALTAHSDKNWMLLLIDADQDSSTGWYGYDFLINKSVVDSKTTTLMQYSVSSESWVKTANLKYSCAGNELEIAIPRNIVGLNSNSLSFDFHWSDNPQDLKNPISLCANGDSAPNRRFNYRCDWTKQNPQN